ncbi:efflux RND transporter periplasmic adaptor subunit [Roseibium sp. HPY-6]|uniref:efflux RND transporter periplasmic adaptor subunit n=1 Tax=Roseibium sp. HPY-6 TaxID=3229852 RepID=UPI0033905DEE
MTDTTRQRKTRPLSVLGLLFILLPMTPSQAEELVFDGTVEVRETAVLSAGTDGQLTEILFQGGELVSAGQALMRQDTRSLDIDVQMAEAQLKAADAQLAAAQQRASRLTTLSERNVASDASLDDATALLAASDARRLIAAAQLNQAELALEKATIRAPIAGIISRPSAALGAFLEAEAGPPLARIVQLDPVLVAYKVPYETRIATLRTSNAKTLEDLFPRLSLAVRLQSGETVAEGLTPEFASATVDETSGALTVFTVVPNPDRILRPGMSVVVTADLIQD